MREGKSEKASLSDSKVEKRGCSSCVIMLHFIGLQACKTLTLLNFSFPSGDDVINTAFAFSDVNFMFSLHYLM